MKAGIFHQLKVTEAAGLTYREKEQLAVNGLVRIAEQSRTVHSNSVLKFGGSTRVRVGVFQ